MAGGGHGSDRKMRKIRSGGKSARPEKNLKKNGGILTFKFYSDIIQ